MAVRVRSRALGTALPSAETKWERRVAGDATRRLATLVLPSVDRTTGFVLREAPALRDRGDGAPIVQLLLLLDRKPSAGDEDVSPYVQGGVLNVEVTTAVPGWALDALAEADGRTYEPLFVRSGLLELRGGTGQERRILSQVECSGSSPGGALSLSLDRADALAALGAFDGEATSLSIRAALQFLASTPALDIRLRGRWSDVYDAFAERANEGVLGVPQIADAVGALLETANLFVESLSNGAGDEQLSLANREPIVDGLPRVSAVVLERLDPSLAPTDPTARYRLRSRPNEAFPLDATLRTSSSLLRTVVVEAPIEAMLDGVLGGRERSQFLQLQFPSAGNGRIGFEEPRRLASRVDGAPIGSRGHETTALSALDGTFRSLTHSMRPRAARPPAAALLASNLVRPPQAIRFDRLSQNWWLDDLVIGVDQRPRHLPIVDAIDAPLWKDRLDAARRWYAPVFTLVDPERNQSAETSPYTFSVRRIGTTAEGRPALVGSISFRLRRTPSRDTQAAIESEPNAHAAPVPHLGLSVALSIPYLDERDNSLERRSLPATITEDGELVHARVDLINEVLRLAYGALAVEGFQSEAARVEVAYSYEAYVPIEGREVDWVAGHARAAVALADHDARRELRPLALATMPVGPHRPSGVAAASAHLRPTPAALSVLAASLPAHVVASGRPPSQVLAEAIWRTSERDA